MVVKRLIGCVDSFAIEYAIESNSPKKMGKIRIWLKGNYLGAYDDVNILSVTLHQLEKLSPECLEEIVAKGKSEEEIYSYIKSGTCADNGKFMLSLGESFDDFSIVVYLSGEKIKFLWELHEDPFYTYPNYPRGLLSADIPVETLREVISEFRRELE